MIWVYMIKKLSKIWVSVNWQKMLFLIICFFGIVLLMQVSLKQAGVTENNIQRRLEGSELAFYKSLSGGWTTFDIATLTNFATARYFILCSVNCSDDRWRYILAGRHVCPVTHFESGTSVDVSLNRSQSRTESLWCLENGAWRRLWITDATSQTGAR